MFGRYSDKKHLADASKFPSMCYELEGKRFILGYVSQEQLKVLGENSNLEYATGTLVLLRREHGRWILESQLLSGDPMDVVTYRLTANGRVICLSGGTNQEKWLRVMEDFHSDILNLLKP
ncbi:hypothetical protein CCB80_03290 [Armatimonadetes bacterium Uphvl-Ar1]|nr:hypothetical protein CCB80_03290 [Armatimonadetes bacterium Uphvl-Ar1]